ncbi:hypothetical protein AB0A74_39430 [Saccharothrix sp. NPDC042600]|uniref:hypothetical protein n=1 Tax=Saccharothrix TaxID=2071 RepID=UPI0033F1760E|nr:hypothetical protein GCM10017745_37720 [Saccharothrix mutabilis subsp. capreolus]
MLLRSAIFGLLLLIPGGGLAQAAPLGEVVVTPGESKDAAPVRLGTTAGCPAQSAAYYATMRGAGLPAEGLVIVPNGDVGLSHDGPFEVPMALTFRDFAADNNVTFTGRYDIVLHCIDPFTQESHGEFTGTLDFVEPARYVAVGAAKGPQRPSAPLIVPADPPVGRPTDTPPPAPDSTPTAAAAPAETGGGQPFLYLAIGVVGGVAVIAAGSALRRRRSPAD